MGVFGIEGILSEIFCCLLFETGLLSVVDEKTQAIFTKFDFFDNGNSCGFIPPRAGNGCWTVERKKAFYKVHDDGFIYHRRVQMPNSGSPGGCDVRTAQTD